MAANPFDEFDQPASANPFDEFDDKPAPKPAGIGRKVADVGLSVGKGIIGVPEAVVGAADLVTGGRAGQAVEAAGVRFKDAKQVLTDLQSEDLKGKQQQFEDADGILPKVGVALQNPSIVANVAAESLPLMGLGGVAGRAVLPALGARRFAGPLAGAIGEGAVGAGSAAEQIRQESLDGTLTGEQAALAAGSGAATALIGAAGGAAAQRLGIADPDTLITQGTRQVGLGARKTPKGTARRIAEGAVAEGLFEEVPQSISEQAFQNAALDRPITEGMESAAVLGGLAGGVMGGVAGGISRPTAPPPLPGPLTTAAALLPAPVVTVDSEGRAKMDGVPSGGFSAKAGNAQAPEDFMGATEGARTPPPPPAPAGLLPPPADVLVDPQGNARAFGQIPQRQPATGDVRETGAVGRGRGSEQVPQRRLPGPRIEVDRQDVATTAEDRNDALQVQRASRAADRERRRELGLPQVQDGDVLNEQGKPFRARFAAVRAAKQAGRGFQAVEVEGGFVARRVKEAAQDVEVKNAAPPQPAPAAVPGAAAPAPSPAPVQPAAGERAGAVPEPVVAAAPVPAVAPAQGKPPAAPVTPPAPPVTPPAGLRVGITPGDAQPVSVRNGVVHIGEYPAVNYDTGEDVRVPEGATPMQIRKALADAGSLSKRQKFFGGEPATAPAPTVAPAPAPQQNEGLTSREADTQARTSEQAETAANTPKGGGSPAPDVAPAVTPQAAQETPPTGGPAPAPEPAKPQIKLIGKAPNLAVLIDGTPFRSGFKNPIEATRAAEAEIARRQALVDGARSEIPEGQDAGDAPEKAPGERWTTDRGAMPGEAMAWLDGDAETGKAAMYQVRKEDGSGTSYYEVRGDGGRVIARGSTPREAAQRAESSLAQPAAESGEKPLTRAEIVEMLAAGHVKIGPFKVRIEQTAGGRYKANVTAPTFNTVIETPHTIDAIGIVSFRERVADRLMDMQRDLGAAPAPSPAPTPAPAPADPFAEQNTVKRRKAVLAILGDGWRAEAGNEGRRDHFKKRVGDVDLLLRKEKTVDGEFYVGASAFRGPRKGWSSFTNEPKTLLEAKEAADRLAVAGAAPTAAPRETVEQAAAPAGPPPKLDLTPAADRIGPEGWPRNTYDESWEKVSEAPTEDEIRAAGVAIKPGMWLHPNYGTGVNHQVVQVVTQDTHKGDPRWQQSDEVFTQLHLIDPARARAKTMYHQVFLRNGKLYEATPEWADDGESQVHARIYVLDGPMQLQGTAPAPAPTPAPAPAAPVRPSRETIELRKRVSVMRSLIDCLNRGKA